MSYVRWQGLWKNDAIGATPINQGAMNHIEDAFVTQDARIATIESLASLKGDIITVSAPGVFQRIGHGTDGQVLISRSTATYGINWENLPAGGGGSVPLTTKGDLLGVDSTGALIRIPINANTGYMLKVGPTQVGGFNWGAENYAFVKNQGGANLQQRPILNFTGAGVTAQENSVTGVTDVIISGGSGYNTIYYNGGPVYPVRNWLNFKGAGVVVSDNDGGNNATNVTIGSTQSLTGLQFQQITNPNSNVFLCATVGNSWILLDHSANNGSVIAIKDPGNDLAQIVYIAVEQDSIGGASWEFSPMTIVWENGFGPTGLYSPLDLSAGSITLIRLEWMGARYGWMGSLQTAVPQLLTPFPSTWTYQGTLNTFGSTGFSGSPALGFDPARSHSVRYVPTTSLGYKMAMDALFTLFSPAMRTRLAANLPILEMCWRNPTDGPLGSFSRGFYENAAAGYNSSLGSHQSLCTYGNLFRQDGNVPHIVAHETSHLLSATFFGGNNPNEPGFDTAKLISQQTAMINLSADIQANGGPANNDEWFAEMEAGRREQIVGLTGGGMGQAGRQIPQVGPNTTGSSTPASRVASFNNIMTTTAGYIF